MAGPGAPAAGLAAGFFAAGAGLGASFLATGAGLGAEAAGFLASAPSLGAGFLASPGAGAAIQDTCNSQSCVWDLSLCSCSHPSAYFMLYAVQLIVKPTIYMLTCKLAHAQHC